MVAILTTGLNVIERARLHCGLAKKQIIDLLEANDTDIWLDNDQLDADEIQGALALIATFDGWVEMIRAKLEETGPLDILWFTKTISDASHCDLSGWQAERWRTSGFLTTERWETRGQNHSRTWLYGPDEWLALVDAHRRVLQEPAEGEDKPRRSGPLAPAFLYYLRSLNVNA